MYTGLIRLKTQREGDITGVLDQVIHEGIFVEKGLIRIDTCKTIQYPSIIHELFPVRRDGRKPRRPLFTDFRFHNLGIGFRGGRFADTGRYELTGDEEDIGAFRTPSLRNAARSAPYMHDGSLPTLEVVVEFYNAGGRPNPNLSPLIRPLFLADHEKAALVAFLYALSEDDPRHHGRQSRR